jgi:hypothetical protein
MEQDDRLPPQRSSPSLIRTLSKHHWDHAKEEMIENGLSQKVIATKDLWKFTVQKKNGVLQEQTWYNNRLIYST